MDIRLLQQIEELNPWLIDDKVRVSNLDEYIPRRQVETLLMKDWDPMWTILVGPRQAGKTTIGKFLSDKLIDEGRFRQLLYLNCDLIEVRNWLTSITFLRDVKEQFKIEKYILFIDEVQRLPNPGLLLKSIADLNLPIKPIASGSSQLEIKSRVQEYLTGRHLESVILPLSSDEIGKRASISQVLLYGSYPKIVLSEQKRILLKQLYDDYISKDIIEILKVGKPDVMQKLVGLVAHSSGQLVNYEQLATDCRVSIPTVQNYLSILEKTYVIQRLAPFVGNKRTEITANPIYFFIDNGFRNQALKNFSDVENRVDRGLLVQGYVFQEIRKLKSTSFLDFDIHFWRTKGGAEVDFVLRESDRFILPIEVKYRNLKRLKVSRGVRSFIQAYRPKDAIIVTKSTLGNLEVDGCAVMFIPVEQIADLHKLITKILPAPL